jgi:hypothetical protein
MVVGIDQGTCKNHWDGVEDVASAYRWRGVPVVIHNLVQRYPLSKSLPLLSRMVGCAKVGERLVQDEHEEA